MALKDFFVDMQFMDKRTVEDGYGGVTDGFIPGAKFRAGITTKQSTEAQIAYQQGLKTIYTIVFEPNVQLHFGDRVKRISDGRVFRVTSNAQDMTTPARANLRMSQVSAEVIEP